LESRRCEERLLAPADRKYVPTSPAEISTVELAIVVVVVNDEGTRTLTAAARDDRFPDGHISRLGASVHAINGLDQAEPTVL
jgi:hypothetical protein